jgi:ribosome maturation factor RimP
MELLTKIRKYLNDVLLKDRNLELYDLTYRREASGNVLRVMIDGQQVTLSTLEYLTKELVKWVNSDSDAKLANYRIEVSTPGINRILRNLEDFKKYIGSKCIISLKPNNLLNRRQIKGNILSIEGDTISIEENNKLINIRFNDIKNSKLDSDIVFRRINE